MKTYNQEIKPVDPRRPLYNELLSKIASLEKENEELQATFDLSWDAQMRAVAEWRKQDPEGRRLKLPDQKEHTLWLITELEEAKAKLTAQSEALRVAEEAFQKIVTWGKQHDEMNNMYATALNTLSAITQLRKGDEV